MAEIKYKLLVLDVDGTLTDSGVYYDEKGNELKKFSTRDAAGFFAAQYAGIKTMILTGRESALTARRMKEMKADYVFQGVKVKAAFLEEFMKENGFKKEEAIYIGDDLNDIPPMKLCGFVGCPADACEEVKEIADYVAKLEGGHGAVRDVVEKILRDNGIWEEAVEKIYYSGT